MYNQDHNQEYIQEDNLFLESDKANILTNNGSQATFFLNPQLILNPKVPMYLSLLESNCMYNEPNIIAGVNNKLYFKGIDLLGNAQDFVYEFETGLYTIDMLTEDFQEELVILCGSSNQYQFEFGTNTYNDTTYVTFRSVYCTGTVNWSIDCTKPNNVMTTLGFPASQGILTVSQFNQSIDSTSNSQLLNNLKSYIITCNLVSNSYYNSNTTNVIANFTPKNTTPSTSYRYEPRHLSRARLNRNNIVDKVVISFYNQNMKPCDFTGGVTGATPYPFNVRLRISSINN